MQIAVNDAITIIISVIALLISSGTYFTSRKKSLNVHIRLKILSKRVQDNIHSLHYSFRTIVNFPIEETMKSKQTEYEIHRKNLQLKLNLFCELLEKDVKIKRKHKEEILTVIGEIEDDLHTLGEIELDTNDDETFSEDLIAIIKNHAKKIDSLI